MSKSSQLDDRPVDATLEETLVQIVRDRYLAGNFVEVTLKRVREAAEQSLNLEEGFFKRDEKWNAESKRLITETVQTLEGGTASSPAKSSVKSSQTTPRRTIPKSAIPQKQKRAKTATQAVESPVGTASSKKRRRADYESASELETESSASTTPEPPSKSKKPLPSAHENGTAKHNPRKETQPKSPTITQEDSDSEMSVLIDEEPKPKARRQKSGSGKPKKATGPPLGPQDEEIKTLQGWLVKCGIRKMWHKELAPFDSARDKISHLKDMLSDAGMKGRYSQEKANEIRERRELAADLEAVKEGNKTWGMDEGSAEEDQNGDRKPRRRLAKGLKELAFLDDGNDEDSD